MWWAAGASGFHSRSGAKRVTARLLLDSIFLRPAACREQSGANQRGKAQLEAAAATHEGHIPWAAGAAATSASSLLTAVSVRC